MHPHCQPAHFDRRIVSARITGLCVAKTGNTERMLILMAIEGMMPSSESGLVNPLSD